MSTINLGDIVKLKKPYNPTVITEGERTQRRQILALRKEMVGESAAWEHWSGFTHGIVVEHLGKNGLGEQSVSLHLYDPELGVIMMGPNNIPEYVDRSSSEFILWKIATETGYLPVDPLAELTQETEELGLYDEKKDDR